ncbi:hypothetical protein C8R44DRAFT_985169, partial [Mycena epipterygia]
MQEPSNELPQELVAHIISFLHDSPADQRAPWFPVPQSEKERLWARFIETFKNSPHIRHITAHHTDPSDFLQLWTRCSPNLIDLELHYSSTSTKIFLPALHPPSTFPLESLNLHVMTPVSLRDWLVHPLCPFYFSGVTSLSVSDNTELLASQKFAQAMRTIQTLDFTAILLRNSIPLPRRETWLGVLDQGFQSHPKIVIVGLLVGTVSEQFDSILSNLPDLPTVEFEMHALEYAGMMSKLSLLRSKNLVRDISTSVL